MPIYEYSCGSCEHEFEVLVRSRADAQQDLRCPRCQSTTVERKISVFAAHQGSWKPVSPPPGGCSQCCNPDGPCSI